MKLKTLTRNPLFIAGSLSIALISNAGAASLDPNAYDIFATLTGSGSASGVPLSAELGITIDSTSTTTWTLLNTAPASSGPTSGGQGAGDPPRIDELFFGLEGFDGTATSPYNANDLTMSINTGLSDVDSGWELQNGGASGGGGTFALVNTATDNTQNLGVDLRLVFSLTTTAFDWSIDTFLNAPNSFNGANETEWQVAASFQTVDSDGEDSGVAVGRYEEGGRDLDPIPEPTIVLLLGSGLLAWFGFTRKSIS